MEQIFPIFLFLALGMVLKKLAVFPADTDRVLNLFVIYIALPSLIFLQIPQLSFSLDILVPVIMPWLACCFSAMFVLMAGRFFTWSHETTGALLLVVPLGNTSFLGIPMVESFFGSNHISYAVLYDQFGSFLALSTYGAVILSLYSGSGKNTLGSLLKNIFLFPPFIALVLALLLRSREYPPWLAASFSHGAASLIPVIMVAVGFQMRILLPVADLKPFIVGLGIRMVIVPLIFLYTCKIMHLTGPATQVSIFETAMPPMVTAAAIASVAGLKPKLASAMVGWGIIFSFLTLPFFFQFLQKV